MFDLERCMAIQGFTEPDELQWLYVRARTMSSVVEIGCWKGRSAAALGQACLNTWTVDTFKGSPSELNAAHAEAVNGNLMQEADANIDNLPVIILPMSSLEASRKFREVDMVFIDGEHTFEAVLMDLICWAPKAKKLLCGHDWDFEGVTKALSVYGIPFEMGPGSLWFMEVIR